MSEGVFFTVGKRLGLGFSIVLLLFVGVTLVGVSKVGIINQNLTQITDVNAVKQRYAINFRGSVHDRAISLRDMVLVEENEINAVKADINKLDAFYQTSAAAMDKIFTERTDISQEERDILSQIKDIERQTLPLIKSVTELREKGDLEGAHDTLLYEARPLFIEWLLAINKFIDYQETKNQAATEDTRIVASNFQELMLSLTALALVAGIVIASLIARYLKNTLGCEPQEAVTVLSRIASGDLSTKLDVKNPNSMLGAVASMQEKLHATFSELSVSETKLSQQAHLVSESSMTARDAAASQSEFSAATEASISKISASIAEISSIASKAEQNSVEASKLSKQGVDVVQNATNKMASIAQLVIESSKQISGLQTRTEEIGGIADLIKEIANQTNLLALNAAIEAARAGDSGRGFGVVADEVRNLAERTSGATAQIAQMIENIQSDTQLTVKAMNEATPQVELGLSLAHEASDMLQRIYTQAVDSAAQAHGVTEATSRQVSMADEISEHMRSITNKSQDTYHAMQENTTVVGELEGIAISLVELVNKYRL